MYLCLLKSPGCKCLMLLHVDDIFAVCSQSFLDEHLLKALKTKYKVSAEAFRNVGDSITFLKRKIVLEDVLKLVMYPHPKHFDTLFELMRVKKTWKPKHTPAHAQALEVVQSPELGPQQSSTYRSAVGILPCSDTLLPSIQTIKITLIKLERKIYSKIIQITHTQISTILNSYINFAPPFSSNESGEHLS